MARFTAQGALKLPFSSETRDPISQRGGSLRFLDPVLPQVSQCCKRMGREWGSCRVWSVGSKRPSGSSRQRDEDASLEEDSAEVIGDDDDEFGRDELACFRGLVLDISYRPVNVVCWKRAICLDFMEKADVLEYYDQAVSSPNGSYYIPAVLRVPNLLQVVKRRRIKHNLSRKSIFFRDHYICQYCSSRDNLTIDHVLPTSRGGEWKWENLVRLHQVQHENYLSSLYFSIFYLVFFFIAFFMTLWFPDIMLDSLHLRPTKGCNMFYMLATPRELINYILMCPSASTIRKMVTACSKCNSKKGQKTLEQANMKLIKTPKAPKEFDILSIPLTSSALNMLMVRRETPEEWRQYLGKPSPTEK